MHKKRFLYFAAAPMAALVLLIAVWAALYGAARAISLSPNPTTIQSGSVLINQVAWGGTAASANDEWIELYNTTDAPILLDNWILAAADGSPQVALSGTIAARAFFVLERADEQSIHDLPADQVYGTNGSSWALSNAGETLTLRDPSGALVDSVNADGGAWPAGSASPDYYTMERIDPNAPGDDDNWASNDGVFRGGHDANGDSLNGTPQTRNSAASLAADLLVSKSGPAQAWANEQITYSLRLRNSGNLTSVLWLTDSLPPSLTFGSQSSALLLEGLGTLTFSQPSSHTLVWRLDSLPASPGWAALLTVTANIEAGAPGVIYNRLEATGSVSELAPINNTAVVATSVLQPQPDLSLSKSGPQIAQPGDLITYSLHLSNTGRLTATHVRLTDTLPAALTFVSQNSAFSFTRQHDQLYWSLGDLAFDSHAITVTAQVSSNAVGHVTNLVTVATRLSETLLTNNNAAWTTQLIAPSAPRDMLINEVAWGGTAADSGDEWLELYNNTAFSITMAGWTLRSADGSPNIALDGVISPAGYYLLERSDDQTISDLNADQVYQGSLVNGGESITLTDGLGQVIDSVNADGGDWPAGSGSPRYYSMERITPSAPGDDENWASNNGLVRNGHDAAGNPLNATPKAQNSAYTPPPPPQADLSASLLGPAQAAPGALLTYTLRLSNSGTISATGVHLSNTLPAAVAFVSQTSHYTFTQNRQQLYWSLDHLPSTAHAITVNAQIALTFTGRLVSVITASTTASETLHHNNVASCTTRVYLSSVPLDVVINEVAWMGTSADAGDEWIELYNNTARDLDLSDWTLSDGGDVSVTLDGLVLAGGYYLLERGDDQTLGDLPADQLYSGGLSNAGEPLTLRDATGLVIDSANQAGGAWPAGLNTLRRSMERIAPSAPDSDDNWATNDGLTQNGRDAEGNPVSGTPKAQNSAYDPPPPPQADLSVAILSPNYAAPGQFITWSLHLSNTGTLTATQSRLTGALPMTIHFITQTASVSFTQGRQLGWDLGNLPAGAQAYITFSGQISDNAQTSVVVVVTATTSSSESNTANNVAVRSISLGQENAPRVLIAAALVNGYAPNTEDDEAIQLVNIGGAPLDLSGWRLNDSGDDGSCAAFSPALSATLAPGQRIWLAKSASAFYASFGFGPDYETDDSDSFVPDLDGSWPGYSNGGDEVVLLDADGVIADALVYGTGNPDEVGEGHWCDAPLAYLNGARDDGQIFARKLGVLIERPFKVYLPLVQRTGPPGAARRSDALNSLRLPRQPLDSNSQSDWIQSTASGALLYGPVNEGDLIGKRTLYPAWTSDRFSQTLRVTTSAHLTVAVAPDNSYKAIVAQLQRAQESIYLEGYSLTNLHFGRVISDLIATRGLSVTILLDTATYSENREKWICQQIEQVGGRVYFMHNLDGAKRYANQHAKFIIIDERVLIVGSENYGYGAMPVDDVSDGTFGNRGAILMTNAAPVVGWAVEIFRADADPTRLDVARWGARQEFGPPPLGYTPPITTGGGSGYQVLAAEPFSVQAEMYFEVVQSPETSLSYHQGLINLLLQAGSGDVVLVEMLNEALQWGGVNGELVTDPNPRLEAYIQAARQGATVRVLLDEEITAGGNRETVDYINAIAARESLDLQASAQNPTGRGIHNKMVLAHIDGQGYVFVGSVNGTVTSHRRNRELALLVASDAAFDYLGRIFDFDWEPLKRVYLPIVLRDCVGAADHALISEVFYNPVGPEPDREWIEIYNPTGLELDLSGYRLGDAAKRDDYEGLFLFPPETRLLPRTTLLVAVRGTEFREANGFDPDFEIVESDPHVPNLLNDPTWGARDLLLLGNQGDEVLLLDPGYALVDGLVYGIGKYPGVAAFVGALSANHSLERYPAEADTNDCQRDFRDQALPTPGRIP